MMIHNEQKAKPDLIDNFKAVGRGLKLIFFDPIQEIYLGMKTGALPSTACWIVGTALSLLLFFYLDDRLLGYFGKRSLGPGRFRELVGISSIFWGFFGWGYYRLGLRMRRVQKLERTFFNANIETRLKERPQLISDVPIDDFTRRLRLKGRGIPVTSYLNAKGFIESGLNVFVSKIEHPKGNREIVDIIYTTDELPSFWCLSGLKGYSDFTFPIGRSHRGEIKGSLLKIPHYLVAGESGGGKSSFLRMMLAVLLANNSDLDVYHIDFKEGMENQVFEGFENIVLINNPQDAAAKLNQVKDIMDKRMRDFKTAKARSLEMYNSLQTNSTDRERRIVIVVDEISELVPTIGGKSNSTLAEINSILNRISRMGRAVGLNLVVGTQKPDAKNLDATIKANLSGIVCFPVTHFSQSTVVLGNSRASDLNREIPGRAIWKNGSFMTEVQTPFLTEKEVADARSRAAKFWAKSDSLGKTTSEAERQTPPANPDQGGVSTSSNALAMENSKLRSREGAGF